MSAAQVACIQGMQKELLKGKDANFSEYCHDDCTFVVPGGPPLPMAVLAGFCDTMLQAFPWTNDCKVPEGQSGDVITAMTKQNIGVMKGDIAALGPFPAVKMEDVAPELRSKAIILPWETGTYTFEGDKLKHATYAPDSPPQDLDGDATTMDLRISVGFPSVYLSLGVNINPNPDMIMMMTLADFKEFSDAFAEHKNSKSFTVKGKEIKAPYARGDFVDSSTEEMFQDIADPNKVLMTLNNVDTYKMGLCMGHPNFKAGTSEMLVEQSPPRISTPMPAPGTPPPEGNRFPMTLVVCEVEDFDKFLAGFDAHADSNTGPWEGETNLNRKDFCDESKTRRFRSAANPNKVAFVFYDVIVDKMWEFMTHACFANILTSLTMKMDSMATRIATEAPAPKPGLLMGAEVKEFDEWFAGFKYHKDRRTFNYKGKMYPLAKARAEFMDCSHEDLFQDWEDGNKIVGTFLDVDLPVMGEVMGDDDFKVCMEAAVNGEFQPQLMGDPNPENETESCVFVSYEVKDREKWHELFIKAGSTKLELPSGNQPKYCRNEMCDESKTRTFKSAMNTNKVGVMLFDVNLAKVKEFRCDPNFPEFSELLGICEPVVVKVINPMPAPEESA